MNKRINLNNHSDYNGWRNYNTWNVALWISNDYGLYKTAIDFIKNYRGRKPYKDFIKYLGLEREKTSDGVRWMDNSLDYRELNGFMREICK